MIGSTRFQAEFGEDVGDMFLHCAAADDQVSGYSRVGSTLGHQCEDFALARSKGNHGIVPPIADE